MRMNQNISALDSYRENIAKYPPLDPGEQARLFRLFAENRADDALFDRLVTANLRLVLKIAGEYRNCGLDPEDLIQAGNLGLMKAVRRYDPAVGAAFSTYAAEWIRKYIRSALSASARTIRLPDHVLEKIRVLKKADADWRARYNAAPTARDLADALHWSVDAVRRLLRAAETTLSLDASVASGDHDELRRIDTLPDPAPSPADAADAGLRREILASALRTLTPRERTILRQRYGLDGSPCHTLEQIAASIGLTRERVRQIAANAIRRLALALAA